MDNVVQAAIEKKFCHKVEEFSYWPLEAHDEEPKKLPKGTIFYYDLDKVDSALSMKTSLSAERT